LRTRSKSTPSTRTARSSSEVSISPRTERHTKPLVSRICATSEVNKLAIELDVNTEIYQMEKDVYYKMVLASSVNADGSDQFDIIRFENEGSESGMGSLIDQYEYVMHGKVFKYQLKDDDKNM
jgi:DNA-directed RNA polymerases I, II, and III subunit RPABC3